MRNLKRESQLRELKGGEGKKEEALRLYEKKKKVEREEEQDREEGLF